MNKKKITAIAVVVAAIAIAIVGATLAFFTDADDKVTNTFTVGDVEIILDEYDVWTEVDENGLVTYVTVSEATESSRTEDGNEYPDIYPGAVLPKDPQVKNVETNSVYVRMDVTIDNFEAFSGICASHGITNIDSIFDGYSKDEWKRYAETEDTEKDTMTYSYIWYGGNDEPKVLPSGQRTDAIFDNIIVPTCFTNEDLAAIDGFKIEAFAYAIQANGASQDELITELQALNYAE